jgi:hypothetical protein
MPHALIAVGLALTVAGGGERVSDDYPRALALARARQLPLFVEAWAPW